MAILRDTRYPGRWASRTNQSPQGAFKNKSGPTATDGSYAEQDWLNDWDGFFGRLLTVAGITANGNVDNALSSQYYDALTTILPLQSLFTATFATPGNVSIPVVVNGTVRKLIIQWSAWNGTTGSSGANGVYETSGVYTQWATNFTTACYGVWPMVNDVSGVGLQETAWPSSKNNLSGVTILASCRQASTAMSGMVFAIGY